MRLYKDGYRLIIYLPKESVESVLGKVKKMHWLEKVLVVEEESGYSQLILMDCPDKTMQKIQDMYGVEIITIENPDIVTDDWRRYEMTERVIKQLVKREVRKLKDLSVWDKEKVLRRDIEVSGFPDEMRILLEAELKKIVCEKREKSFWSAVKRTKANARKLINTNHWDYFVTLSFLPEFRNDYDVVAKQAKRIFEQCRKMGVVVYYQISYGLNGGWHIHALICGEVKNLVPISTLEISMFHVKTDGMCYKCPQLQEYGVGLHVIQKIQKDYDEAYDYDRITNYLTQHFMDTKRRLQEEGRAGEHLYHCTRGLERGTSERYFVDGITVTLYTNGTNMAAAVMQDLNLEINRGLEFIADAVGYYTGRFKNAMVRYIGNADKLRIMIQTFT